MGPFSTCEVTVSGAGMAVNIEAEIIKQTFEALGYQVEINNPHPTPEPAMGHMKNVINNVKELANKRQSKIVLNVKHEPWPG